MGTTLRKCKVFVSVCSNHLLPSGFIPGSNRAINQSAHDETMLDLHKNNVPALCDSGAGLGFGKDFMRLRHLDNYSTRILGNLHKDEAEFGRHHVESGIRYNSVWLMRYWGAVEHSLHGKVDASGVTAQVCKYLQDGVQSCSGLDNIPHVFDLCRQVDQYGESDCTPDVFLHFQELLYFLECPPDHTLGDLASAQMGDPQKLGELTFARLKEIPDAKGTILQASVDSPDTFYVLNGNKQWVNKSWNDMQDKKDTSLIGKATYKIFDGETTQKFRVFHHLAKRVTSDLLTREIHSDIQSKLEMLSMHLDSAAVQKWAGLD